MAKDKKPSKEELAKLVRKNFKDSNDSPEDVNVALGDVVREARIASDEPRETEEP